MNVLVVEDEFLLRDTIAEELRDAGFEVIEAGTGSEAMIHLADADVLFTDIRLPGAMNGWDIAERCREAQPDLPVIYATGYSHVEPRRVPGSMFFQKPYQAEQVIKAIRQLTAER